MFPAKFALLQWDAYLAPVFILFVYFLRGLEQIWYHIRNEQAEAVPNMVLDLILLLSSASGGVRKGEKRVNFVVILVNRLSGAVEWSDRNGINFVGKRNVPSTTYWNYRRIGSRCPVRFPLQFPTILADFATFSFLTKLVFSLHKLINK